MPPRKIPALHYVDAVTKPPTDLGSTARSLLCAFTALALYGCIAGCRPLAVQESTADSSPVPRANHLSILVMDPLCASLACKCVAGYAQRDYRPLAAALAAELNVEPRVGVAESIRAGRSMLGEFPDIVIGKDSVVRADAAKAGVALVPVARLTGQDGTFLMRGLFVVRDKDPAAGLADVPPAQIVFGPRYDMERHAAALALLAKMGIPVPPRTRVTEGCNEAAVMVVEGKARAAVISSYAWPLLEGCDVIEKGELRVIGRTAAVPFITFLARPEFIRKHGKRVIRTLRRLNRNPDFLKAMESRNGFVIDYHKPESPRGEQQALAQAWGDWRGPGRIAFSPSIPVHLKVPPVVAWRREMTGKALSGIAATTRYVLVADKDAREEKDILRCLRPDTGEEIWHLEYPAPGELDYSNGPRSTPVIHGDRVFFLGAFGDLHCLRISDGAVIWKTNMIKRFGAELPAWGCCSTPLVVPPSFLDGQNASLNQEHLARGPGKNACLKIAARQVQLLAVADFSL